MALPFLSKSARRLQMFGRFYLQEKGSESVCQAARAAKVWAVFYCPFKNIPIENQRVAKRFEKNCKKIWKIVCGACIFVTSIH